MRRSGHAVAVVLAVLLLAVVGCSSSSDGGDPSSSTTSSTAAEAKVSIGELQLAPNPDSVLSYDLTFTTSGPARTQLHVDGPGAGWKVAPEAKATTDHTLPVVGLRPSSSYDVWVTANDGATTSKKVTVATKALPEGFPPFRMTHSDASRMAPGVTMFTVTQTVAPGDKDPMIGNLIGVDAEGSVVWYHRTPSAIGDARMLPSGHILYEYNDLGAQEIDIMGRVVHAWAGRLQLGKFAKDNYGRTTAAPGTIPVDVDSIHHEVSVLPDGNILTISNELRDVSGFTEPMCPDATPTEISTGTYKLITDVIVEFEPDTGRVVHRYPLADYLHPQTDPNDGSICGFGSQTVYPNWVYASEGMVRDWTHANAVILDQAHNRLLVSIRHLDTVIAIKYEADDQGPAGKELWRFGPRGGDFKLTGAGELQYHQHAIELEKDGTLMLFDNGNDRPDTDPFYSRAVRYKIDDTGPRSSWSVSQQWEFRPTIDGDPAYAFFVGDANLLANGNVLVDTGGLIPPQHGVSAQIDEVVPSGKSGGTVVFELQVTDNAGFVYRATRVASLYGGAPTDPS